ncbi:MAG: TetR family transcriptional regulator [Vulcanimicrobiota bacterium]
MPRPKNTDRRRRQIVAGLRQVLAERGYEKATIASIARAAGLTSGLVHYHFASKQAILLELIAELREQVRARQQPADHPKEQLRAFIEARLARGPDADPEAVACWVSIGAEALRQPEVAAVYQQLLAEQKAELETILAALTPRPETDAVAILAAIEGCYQLASAAPELVPVGFAFEAVWRMAGGLLTKI